MNESVTIIKSRLKLVVAIVTLYYIIIEFESCYIEVAAHKTVNSSFWHHDPSSAAPVILTTLFYAKNKAIADSTLRPRCATKPGPPTSRANQIRQIRS